MIAMFADTRASFQKADFPAGQAGIVHKFIADGTPLPSALEHGMVSIKAEPADSAMFGFNPEQ